MLGRLIRQSRVLSRSFSGGDDPYLLHLHPQTDKYPQYAHLHWHTVDPLEVGKYAKLRSKAHFGSHVADDPEPADWLPASDNLNSLTYYKRNFLFNLVLRFQHEAIHSLEDTIDLEDDEGENLLTRVQNEIMSALKPEQMEGAVAFAKKILGEYQAAGVPVTREKISEHVHHFIMSKLTPHQTSHLDHVFTAYLEKIGISNFMNDA